MKVRVLGTAAGGGVPQWNCGCGVCTRARSGGWSRTQDGLAVTADGRAWYLLNASPDLRPQILAAPELAPPPGSRDSPIRGVLLSTAELDHTLGLLALREARSLTVYGSAPVLAALDGPFPVRRLVAPYTDVTWTAIGADRPIDLDGGLRVRAVPVGAKPPRYSAGVPGRDWAVAYHLTDPRTGGVLVYAPCLPGWSGAFASIVDSADVVLVDGTFLGEDEMARATGAGPTASTMGHLAIASSRVEMARHPGRRFLYTHLNNTNPAADPARTDVPVAYDGQCLTL